MRGYCGHIWSSFSTSCTCVLQLILFLLLHQCLYAIQISPLLCSNSRTPFPFLIILLFVNFLEWPIIQRWIIGKMAQIVVGGMGSRVIRWQVMWSALTSVAVALKVPSIPIAPFSLFAISRNSISLTTISISPQFHLSLVGLQTWRISTSLILVLLVKSHPKSPTYPNWFHWISLRIITWE